MLTSFGVLDTRNRIVWTINDFFYRITEPALRPIRNILPNFGGIDLSPWVLVVLLIIARGDSDPGSSSRSFSAPYARC